MCFVCHLNAFLVAVEMTHMLFSLWSYRLISLSQGQLSFVLLTFGRTVIILICREKPPVVVQYQVTVLMIENCHLIDIIWHVIQSGVWTRLNKRGFRFKSDYEQQLFTVRCSFAHLRNFVGSQPQRKTQPWHTEWNWKWVLFWVTTKNQAKKCAFGKSFNSVFGFFSLFLSGSFRSHVFSFSVFNQVYLHLRTPSNEIWVKISANTNISHDIIILRVKNC